MRDDREMVMLSGNCNTTNNSKGEAEDVIPSPSTNHSREEILGRSGLSEHSESVEERVGFEGQGVCEG